MACSRDADANEQIKDACTAIRLVPSEMCCSTLYSKKSERTSLAARMATVMNMPESPPFEALFSKSLYSAVAVHTVELLSAGVLRYPSPCSNTMEATAVLFVQLRTLKNDIVRLENCPPKKLSHRKRSTASKRDTLR